MDFDFHARRRAVRTATLAATFSAAALLWPAGGAQAYKLKVLYSFCAQTNCTDGQAPSAYAPLVMDAAGNLFGTTAGGGDKGDGVIFKLSPAGRPQEMEIRTDLQLLRRDCLRRRHDAHRQSGSRRERQPLWRYQVRRR